MHSFLFNHKIHNKLIYKQRKTKVINSRYQIKTATMQITSTNFIEENIKDTIILQKVAIVIKVMHVKKVGHTSEFPFGIF